MSNVIQFLEALGRTPGVGMTYAVDVAALDINAAQRQALLERDHGSLCKLLGGRNDMRCIIFQQETLEAPARTA